jgi:hypothetical protein
VIPYIQPKIGHVLSAGSTKSTGRLLAGEDETDSLARQAGKGLR